MNIWINTLSIGSNKGFHHGNNARLDKRISFCIPPQISIKDFFCWVIVFLPSRQKPFFPPRPKSQYNNKYKVQIYVSLPCF